MVRFSTGKPAGAPIDVLTGFVSEGGDAWGRPVGVALDAKGALLVADDVGGVVWRVASANANRPLAATGATATADTAKKQ